MSRDQVIPVEAVFDQQLPVGLHGVLVGAGDYPHPVPGKRGFRAPVPTLCRVCGVVGAGLVRDQVKVLSCARQVCDQVVNVRVETHEDEAPVAFDPGRLLEAQFAPVEVGAVSLFAGDADQLSIGVERPGVVEALEDFGVALVAAADQCAPMGTGIEEHLYLAISITGKEKRAACYGAAAVVSRVLHFGLVSQVDPALVEDQFLFLLE